MKFRPFLFPAALLTVSGSLLTWLLLADPPKPPNAAAAPFSGPETLERTGDAFAATGQLRLAKPSAPAPQPDRIRDVSPDGVTAPPVSGTLKRIEPSERYLELKNPAVVPVSDQPLEFARVHVVDSGNLRINKLELKLAHIRPLAVDATCANDLGAPWPCGTRARTFLRGIIRQFKISCAKIEELGPQQLLVTCEKGKLDLSTQLLRFGWVDPTPDAPEELKELAAQAKATKIGKWKTEWLVDVPARDWENAPTAALPGLEELQPETVDWSQSALEN